MNNITSSKQDWAVYLSTEWSVAGASVYLSNIDIAKHPNKICLMICDIWPLNARSTPQNKKPGSRCMSTSSLLKQVAGDEPLDHPSRNNDKQASHHLKMSPFCRTNSSNKMQNSSPMSWWCIRDLQLQGNGTYDKKIWCLPGHLKIQKEEPFSPWVMWKNSLCI